jgi:hypothetical protein
VQLQHFPNSTPTDFYNAWLPAASGKERNKKLTRRVGASVDSFD